MKAPKPATKEPGASTKIDLYRDHQAEYAAKRHPALVKIAPKGTRHAKSP